MRLIDADALYEDMIHEMCGTGYQTEALRLIRYAPTITPPPNPPLTLEELRRMNLCGWCWVEVLVPSAFRKPMKSGYYMKFHDYTEDEAFTCGWPGTIFEFDYTDYEKTWLAYRRKPEEGTT